MKCFFRLAVLLGVISTWSTVYAQETQVAYPAIDTTRINAFLQQQMQRDGIPGLAISITSRRGLIYAKGFGRDHQQSIQPETLFLIGSMSKAFTATAIMQLVESKHIDLDAPVQDYLVGFAPGGAMGDVTVRHLLQQRSGFERRDGFSMPGAAGAVDGRLAYEPGTAFSYSNLNYSLLGQVLEQASGMSYGSYLHRHIFERLEMSTASAHPRIAPDERIVAGRQYAFWPTIKGAQPRFPPEAVPSGFIRASVLDMAAFLQAHLKADTSSGLGLAKEHFRMLHNPPGDAEYGYAMGWVRGRWTDTPSLQHSGLTAAYSSIMVMLPEVDYGVTILTNANSFTAKDHLMDGVLRILREQEPIRYTRNERWLRLVLLGAFSWGLVGFARRVSAWHQAGYPTSIASSAKNLTQLGLSMAINGALLFGIPWYMEVPLAQVPRLQPDLGYALIVGVGVGVLDGIVKAFLSER